MADPSRHKSMDTLRVLHWSLGRASQMGLRAPVAARGRKSEENQQSRHFTVTAGSGRGSAPGASSSSASRGAPGGSSLPSGPTHGRWQLRQMKKGSSWNRVGEFSFADVVEKGYLPEDRADGCDGEYEQVAYAFKTLIDPHLDKALASKVLKTWMREVDAPPRRPPNR
jgi:hypothetical protein